MINAVRNTPYVDVPPAGYNGETLKLSVKFYNGDLRDKTLLDK